MVAIGAVQAVFSSCEMETIQEKRKDRITLSRRSIVFRSAYCSQRKHYRFLPFLRNHGINRIVCGNSHPNGLIVIIKKDRAGKRSSVARKYVLVAGRHSHN